MEQAMPLAVTPLRLNGADGGASRFGLIMVDIVNGFATVGAGNLAPPVPNAQVSHMVDEAVRLSRTFADQGWPMLAFMDSHEPGKPEPPYPPHCEIGTGEEDLVPELAWLESEAAATLVRKDCINGFVGAIRPNGSNALVDWLNDEMITDVLVVGICTDICVMDMVLTLLSGRNHGLVPVLREVHVYNQGCATYDLPRAVAEELALGSHAAHPQDATHHMGLYFMAARGARLVDHVVVD
ncbi:MAG: isochorismatase family protein [Rhodospirillaceae bacterium]|nr:isochorismatase family protein [Rhodospirillaceae bacterium]MBT4042383.1 isochorismatase family protein [Rhodospirillaceae bacterium]MBT4688412.1 isochorismatase family protein [Rhodospirillaceae bacterium]MBT5081770.1 isochorismatase family protein [Rhodospirillaceae bacterium]MBT5527368.1 isochorismatase family protein [Rhodospirillaceae bacterium]